MEDPPRYTCSDYREEMRLLALRKRLHESSMEPEERQALIREIEELEAKMNMR